MGRAQPRVKNEGVGSADVGVLAINAATRSSLPGEKLYLFVQELPVYTLSRK